MQPTITTPTSTKPPESFQIRCVNQRHHMIHVMGSDDVNSIGPCDNARGGDDQPLWPVASHLMAWARRIACSSMIRNSGVASASSYDPRTRLGRKGMDGIKPAAIRVLVVEDDALIGALLAEMLEDMGHDVCGVEATEAGAVAAATHCHPDLLIVDVRLGDGSGIAAVDEIHRTSPVAHVFVSGDISGVQLLRPGAAILAKPYRETDLALVIQRALDARPLS
jgi:two-component system, response regulator PdtaR